MMNKVSMKAAAVVIAMGFMAAPMTTWAADMASWQRSVVGVIAKKQVYPRAAMSQEIEGRAKVKMTIDRAGKITNYEMVESTGSDLLDAEVVKLMERINPLPAPPADASDSNLTFVLPLAWVLE
ncbi:MAG: energy transducer TonB [Sphingomonadales bacterium]|nr:energy transducer TonB [Sphingomonadales bacterium]